MRRALMFVVAVMLFAVGSRAPVGAASADTPASSCIVDHVIDGDSFACTSGIQVRMLQVNAQGLGDCGGEWTKAALANIFLPPGTTVRLDYDQVTKDKYGRALAAPIVTGSDGTDYNLSIVMVYVGLATSAYYGDNAKYLEWAHAAENWARVAQWNMWAPGGPYYGGQPAPCNGIPLGHVGRVRVLYVMPNDRARRSDYFDAVANALDNVQAWYGQQLGGPTFPLYGPEPETCVLAHPAAYYANDTWTKVLSDVQPCAPVVNPSSMFAWVLYVDVVHACNAPGRLGGASNNVTMMPRQDMDGLIGAHYADDCGVVYNYPPSRYIGGAGHELGHALGLSHPPGCDVGLSTCDHNAMMWTGYVSYPQTYLRPDEKQILAASPFINSDVRAP